MRLGYYPKGSRIGGIRQLTADPAWRGHSFVDILDSFRADIICLQETHVKQEHIGPNLAFMEDYDSFFSTCEAKGAALHGTAVFTRKTSVVPIKAEEGLGSSPVPHGMSKHDCIGSYPSSAQTGLSASRMQELDSEGRVIVLDRDMFVLLVVYGVRQEDKKADRALKKGDFEKMLDARIKNLIENGREVMVVGDLNIIPTSLDCHNPAERAAREGQTRYDWHPSRQWLIELTGPRGPLCDVLRERYPHDEGMFSCWTTEAQRKRNAGSRNDHVLVTPDLLPWIDDIRIERDVFGSDHAPVVVELVDSLDPHGKTLWERVNPGRAISDSPPAPPRIGLQDSLDETDDESIDDLLASPVSQASVFRSRNSSPATSPVPEPACKSLGI